MSLSPQFKEGRTFVSFYLSVDLGTTGCRSILFNERLELLASAYEEYGLITPREKYVEQDAELWWELTKKTLNCALKKANTSPKEVKGISISSQGITIVPVDKDINALSNAISWLDERAEKEIECVKEIIGEQRLFLLTGKPAISLYTLPKIMWMKENQPELYSSAYKLLMPMDFLIAKFTGECVTDHSMASGTLLYDLKKGCWSEELLSSFSIDVDKLPSVTTSGKSVGCVKKSVALELGLSEDCIVAVGAQDQKCAALGAGLSDGVMTVSLGTAAAVTKLWDGAYTHINNGVGWCGYTEDGLYVTEGVINTAATCLRYVRDLMFQGESYDVIDKEAAEARERGSSLLFFPYLSGASSPDFYKGSTGVFYGAGLGTVRADYALAVMEGIAFSIRRMLEAMEAYGNVHTLVLFGGGAKSSFWSQIIADVTGMKIEIPSTTEAAGAGAAMLAAKAAGDTLAPLEFSFEYEPSKLHEVYSKKYLKYRDLEKRMFDIEEAL